MHWDWERGEYMTPNRSLNPRLGRWTQPDPFFHARHGNLQGSNAAILQSGNLFMYVMHNPVRFVDPTGLIAIPAFIWGNMAPGTSGSFISSIVSDLLPSIAHELDGGGSGIAGGGGSSTTTQTWTRTDLTASQRMFVAIIAGESIGTREAWAWVANVIMNRVDRNHMRATSVIEVIQARAQFSAYLPNVPSSQFALAMQYLNYGIAVSDSARQLYRDLINAVLPIYYRIEADITGGAHMFYSPRYMIPRGSSPSWAHHYERVHDIGVDGWYFRFLRSRR